MFVMFVMFVMSPCYRVSLICSCGMYLALFPFDEQTCNLDVASCKWWPDDDDDDSLTILWCGASSWIGEDGKVNLHHFASSILQNACIGQCTPFIFYFFCQQGLKVDWIVKVWPFLHYFDHLRLSCDQPQNKGLGGDQTFIMVRGKLESWVRHGRGRPGCPVLPDAELLQQRWLDNSCHVIQLPLVLSRSQSWHPLQHTVYTLSSPAFSLICSGSSSF